MQMRKFAVFFPESARWDGSYVKSLSSFSLSQQEGLDDMQMRKSERGFDGMSKSLPSFSLSQQEGLDDMQMRHISHCQNPAVNFYTEIKHDFRNRIISQLLINSQKWYIYFWKLDNQTFYVVHSMCLCLQ